MGVGGGGKILNIEKEKVSWSLTISTVGLWEGVNAWSLQRSFDCAMPITCVKLC